MKRLLDKTGTLEGIVVINKPTGMTSHDVVDTVRRKFRMKRVGHAGTLDPLATGVLILLVGKATKLFKEFESFDKAYEATLLLGKKTNTADIEGEVIKEEDFGILDNEDIKRVLKGFEGQTEQIPPMVSAIKMNGKRLYELARKGIEVKRKPRSITIKQLTLLKNELPYLTIRLECSKGTYVRQLAEDIGKKLGSVACITKIKRTKVGNFSIEDAVALDDLNQGHIRRWVD